MDKNQIHLRTEESVKPDRILLLPTILRRLGAVLLVAASAVFLLQRWDTFSQIERYLSFLGFTGSLTLLGVFCGVKLQDSRAARTLLGVVALVVPIHFAQLGGFLYSVFPEPFSTSIQYPEVIAWVAPSTAAALGVTLLGVIVLIPITLFTTTVFARQHARLTAAALLAGSALLLIPLRHPDAIGWIAMAGMVGSFALDAFVLRTKPQITTPEGKYLRAVLFLPTLLLLGRSVYLYNSSAIFAGAAFTGLALLMFAVLPSYTERRGIKLQLQGWAMVPALLASLIFTGELFEVFSMPRELVPTARTVPMAGILLLGSHFSAGCGRSYRLAAAFLFIPIVVLSSLAHPTITNSLIAVSATVLAVVSGYSNASRSTFLLGILGLGVTLSHHLQMAVDISLYSPWMTLAVIGLAAVFASAYVEKNREPVSRMLKDVRSRFASEQ